MKNIIINDAKYEIIENYKDAYNEEETKEKLTDYFNEYDYIVGDYSYDKLRLKGFCDKSNKIFNSVNNFENIKTYITDYCSYECKYFILKKSA